MLQLDGKPRQFEAMFMGLKKQHLPEYPHWMHKDGVEPILVENEEEDREARANGYDNITAGAMSNRSLSNWYWDLEDMSPRQLQVFAKDEYGIDLPIEAGQESLFQAVCELARHDPRNGDRRVLMAHSMKMNYDATIEEIKRMVSPGAIDVETEVTRFEVEM